MSLRIIGLTVEKINVCRESARQSFPTATEIDVGIVCPSHNENLQCSPQGFLKLYIYAFNYIYLVWIIFL